MIDPTTYRMSDTLLLSDMVGCDSVYRYGKANPVFADDCKKLEEGKNLASKVDELQERFGPFSITYGYISPQLSCDIVKYQDPTKPSYHRWDLGAAIDFVAHEWVQGLIKGQRGTAPVYLAHDIDDLFGYSRMITYAESPVICFGTRLEEEGKRYRKALYENRYVGVKKPLYVRYSDNARSRTMQKDNCNIEDWVGQGWPSSHGGGRKQFEHQRTSMYTLMSDFLYDSKAVHRGERNFPFLTIPDRKAKIMQSMQFAGDTIDKLVQHFGMRMSIVSAYKRSDDPKVNWERRFTMQLVPPVGVEADDAAHFLETHAKDLVDKVMVRTMRSGTDRVLIKGHIHG